MTSIPPYDVALEEAEGLAPIAMAGQPVTSPRIAALDGLRGLAIFLVLTWHYFHVDAVVVHGSLLGYLNSLTRLAWSGVDLFFVLSGYLIGGILLDARNSPGYFPAFYARRAYRILPLYVVVVALYLATSPLLPPHPTEPPLYVLATITQNIWVALGGTLYSAWLRVTWSLGVEEQFYLVAPIIIRKLTTPRLAVFIAAIVCAAPLLRAVLWSAGERGWMASYMLTPARADALSLGVAAAMLVRTPVGQHWLLERRVWLYGLLVALMGGFLFFTRMDWSIESVQMSLIGYTCIALLYTTLLLLVVSHSDGLLARLFQFRPLVGLGTIAYALYLFHEPVKYILHLAYLGRPPRLETVRDAGVQLLALLVSIAIARLSWVYFERPLVNRGHRWSYWPDTSKASAE